MHSAMELRADHDLTDVPSIVRGAVKLGLFESVIVLLVSLVSHLLMDGLLQTVLTGVIVARASGGRMPVGDERKLGRSRSRGWLSGPAMGCIYADQATPCRQPDSQSSDGAVAPSLSSRL